MEANPTLLLNEAWRTTPALMAEKLTLGKFIRYRHIDFISDIITRAVFKGGARLIITTPPRHGKSFLISRWVPAWFLHHFPHKRVILASYESSFAATWGRDVRNLIQEHKSLGVRVASDSSAADKWQTTEGGGMFTTGIGGPLTGKGGDLLIIDDPVKNAEEADSPTYRRRAIEWWNTTFRTRAEPGASIIILMTRWHQGDLVGHLLGPDNEIKDEWTVINLPALAEDNDALGRKVGGALCPERYNVEALLNLCKSVGTRAWNALFQGRPSAEQGNLIKREWWKTWDAYPPMWDEQIISCDLNFTGKATSDNVVYQVWGKYGASKFMLDQVRGQWGFTKAIEMFEQLCRKWPNARRKLVENKANGPALEDQLKKHIPGIILVEPKGDKVARVNSVTPTIEAGNCYLPPTRLAPWREVFITECSDFPNGVFDDQVDAMSQALQYFEQRKALPMPIAGHGAI